ncbi:hypothetical protein C8A00DRAFT_47723 [Chaetomidium leptoderma]|uniref:Uncharacterized protein n=1 Tax=Chaetomidium leptoderma TaxID=669021 RepID=A0AAN6VBJ4_9PEZI|nr:hypothetical protein C8A00DRAFT_47723 [Chaetomidium leptoderma]
MDLCINPLRIDVVLWRDVLRRLLSPRPDADDVPADTQTVEFPVLPKNAALADGHLLRWLDDLSTGSLHGWHDHAGKSLYVIPFRWTDKHSKLLGARFNRCAAIVEPVPDLVPGVRLEPSQMAETLTSELATLVQEDVTPARPFSKHHAMEHILSTLFPETLASPKTGAELNLYFGHRIFSKVVRIPYVWSCPALPATSFSQVDAGMPMLAYINRSQLAANRKNLYSVPRGPENEPVSRLQQLRSKKLIPADADHGPYIVAVLLAMAQAHLYPRSSSQSSSQGRKSVRITPPSFRDVKMRVITHDEGNDSSSNFVIYTAVITAAFLDRFMFPHKAPKPQEKFRAGIDISYTTIGFWPVLGLKERLSKALGREIAGDSIYDDPNHKRRRAGMKLLEEEPPSSSDDRPVLSSAAKRRRMARRVVRTWEGMELVS